MHRSSAKDEVIASVEATLCDGFPEVELVDVEIRGGREPVATLFVDRPGGVDLELCAAVTEALDELRTRYALEVSSPGLDRPLRTTAHFEAAAGQRVYVKTAAPLNGRAVYRGVLESADAASVVLRLDEGDVVDLPIDGLAKAHIIYDFEATGGHRE